MIEVHRGSLATNKPKLLYLVTEDWYFCSHRWALAAATQARGYQVAVATRVGEHGRRIQEQQFELFPIDFPRSLRRPWRDLALIGQLFRLYKRENPDIVHHVALKPVLYGWVAASLSGSTSAIVNAPTGLGHIFTANSLSARLMRPVVALLLGLALRRKGSIVIVQNPDDRALLERELGVSPESIVLIPGSGVDLETFRPSTEATGVPVVVFVARLLADKGIYEFVAAAERMRDCGVEARFVLVGAIDTENPSSISRQELDAWCRDELVEWWGWRDDMPLVLQAAHVVCLPSHREGLPKSLVEAAACGRPIVTTDVPGCREVVIDGKNGLLVEPKDIDGLVAAIRQLVEQKDLRQRMGEQGRRHAQRFDLDSVIAETIGLYARVQGN